MRHLSLSEYRTATEVELSDVELAEIRRLAESIAISPSITALGTFDLTPGSHVGAIRISDLAIDIQPKIPLDRLLFLISYSVDPRRWQELDFDFGERDSLLEAIIPGFVIHTRRALRQGLLQGYISVEDSLATVRGRIRFDDQLRDRYGIFPPVEVRYDEFTEDIVENRLIKAALARLGRLRIRSAEVRRSLRAFDAALANVSLVEYHPSQLPEISWTRLNEHYKPAVELAKLILQATSFEVSHGAVRSTAFLVDMNRVFEDFVVTALRESLSVSETVFPQGSYRHTTYLDHGRQIRLQPDISWWQGRECLFVGDVKYKRVDHRGVKHADIYQLLSYTIAADLPGGLLIYAAGEADGAMHEIRHLGKRLQVIPLDLDGTPEQILKQIDVVANRIRGLRDEARGSDYRAIVPHNNRMVLPTRSS
ncbi:McrBC 5-methylcytosine restriction system component [soil metagenome]